MPRPPLSRRRLLQVGSVGLVGSIAGCMGLNESSDQPPEIPIYAYNADTRERDIRLIVSHLGDSGRDRLPIANTYFITAHTTKRLLTVDIERFVLNAYVDDSGTGTAARDVAPDMASYSRAGYLVVIDSEMRDGSQIHVSPLSPENA